MVRKLALSLVALSLLGAPAFAETAAQSKTTQPKTTQPKTTQPKTTQLKTTRTAAPAKPVAHGAHAPGTRHAGHRAMRHHRHVAVGQPRPAVRPASRT